MASNNADHASSNASSKTSKVYWQNEAASAENSQMAKLIGQAAQLFSAPKDYEAFCDWSIRNKDKFWRLFLENSGLVYEGSAARVCVESTDFWTTQWFPDIKLNYAENLMQGAPKDGPVLVGLNELSDHRKEISRETLFQQVASLQKYLRDKIDLRPGDRVAAVLPNCPEAVVAMLAVTSLGGVWSSCSPDFGEQGILDRLSQVEPKFLFVANAVSYGGKRFALAEKNQKVIDSLPSLQGFLEIPNIQDSQLRPWDQIVSSQSGAPTFLRLAFNHPLFIMFSSGTTGKPKCIVHGAGGTLIQHLKEHKLHCDLRSPEKMLYYTTCGWMMWNWLVSALASGVCVYTFDGSPAYPNSDSLWNLVSQENIQVFGTSAKFIGSCRSQNLNLDSLQFPQLRSVLSTGSPLLPEDFDYFYNSIQGANRSIQLASISGGTDIISCFMLGNPLKPVLRGEIQGRGLGMDVCAVNSQGSPVVEEQAELVCATPFPSMPIYFLNDPDFSKYKKAYFEALPGIWHHGDYITMTAKGGIVVHGRSDATLNPGGVRIGTAEIYRQVETHQAIADSLCVGRNIPGDEEVLLFVKLKPNFQLDDELKKALKSRIREGASPRHVPKEIYEVAEIPYTVSGKKVEIAVKRILAGQDPGNREALANPGALDIYKKFQ